jgi:hypothetical protein
VVFFAVVFFVAVFFVAVFFVAVFFVAMVPPGVVGAEGSNRAGSEGKP